MAVVVNGKKISSKILLGLKSRVKKINHQIFLAAIIIGQDRPSHTYVRRKQEAAQSVGIDFLKYSFPASVGKKKLIAKIKEISHHRRLDGLIVQLPLPVALKPFTREILNRIEHHLDVDCLTDLSLGQLLMGNQRLMPPTPAAILEILKYHKISLVSKSVVVIGRGDLIGKPLSALLSRLPVSLTVCDRNTKDISFYTKKADIIICGVGRKNILTGRMVKKGCVVIDAGVGFEGKKMHGDVDFQSVSRKAKLITPVPGGVGPITVAKLLENTVIAAENYISK